MEPIGYNAFMQQQQAEILALRALGYLANHEEFMARFTALSGVAPTDILERADDADMLAGVLDFFLGDEKLLIAFCESEQIAQTLPAQARQILPGAIMDGQ